MARIARFLNAAHPGGTAAPLDFEATREQFRGSGAGEVYKPRSACVRPKLDHFDEAQCDTVLENTHAMWEAFGYSMDGVGAGGGDGGAGSGVGGGGGYATGEVCEQGCDGEHSGEYGRPDGQVGEADMPAPDHCRGPLRKRLSLEVGTAEDRAGEGEGGGEDADGGERGRRCGGR